MSYRITNSEDLVPVLPIAAGRIFNEVWIEEFSEPIRTIILGIRKTLDGIGKTFKIDPYADYQHIGESIYFTQQKGNVGDNHNLETYKEAIM